MKLLILLSCFVPVVLFCQNDTHEIDIAEEATFENGVKIAYRIFNTNPYPKPKLTLRPYFFAGETQKGAAGLGFYTSYTLSKNIDLYGDASWAFQGENRGYNLLNAGGCFYFINKVKWKNKKLSLHSYSDIGDRTLVYKVRKKMPELRKLGLDFGYGKMAFTLNTIRSQVPVFDMTYCYLGVAKNTFRRRSIDVDTGRKYRLAQEVVLYADLVFGLSLNRNDLSDQEFNDLELGVTSLGYRFGINSANKSPERANLSYGLDILLIPYKNVSDGIVTLSIGYLIQHKNRK